MMNKLARIGMCAIVILLACSGRSAESRADSPPRDRKGATASVAAVVYSQPPSSTGGLIPSSERDPDGSATDQWAWDAFTLTTTQDITEIRWSGGYDPAKFGSGGAVVDFTLNIYASIPANTQPDLARPPLRHYGVGNHAGETAGPVLGGVQMYDYSFVLPAAFHALGGTKYWVQIVAFQPGAPDWGLTRGVEGDGFYFRKRASEFMYEIVTGDTSFTLLAAHLNGYQLYLPCIIR